MTYAEIQREIDDLRREHEARVAAEKQARAAIRAAHERSLADARRRRAYADADRAAGSTSGQVTAWRHHVIDLALEEPAIDVVWTTVGVKTATLVGPANTFALPRRRRIVVRPIVDRNEYLGALHELGHCRGERRGMTTIQREVAAWRWARRQSLVWNDEAHGFMAYSLGTYLKVAEEKDIRSVVDAERFLATHAEEMARRDVMTQRAFQREHGVHLCAGRHCRTPGVFAVREVAGAKLCGPCAEQAETDLTAARLKRFRGAPRRTRPRPPGSTRCPKCQVRWSVAGRPCERCWIAEAEARTAS